MSRSPNVRDMWGLLTFQLEMDNWFANCYRGTKTTYTHTHARARARAHTHTHARARNSFLWPQHSNQEFLL